MAVNAVNDILRSISGVLIEKLSDVARAADCDLYFSSNDTGGSGLYDFLLYLQGEFDDMLYDATEPFP